MYDRDKAVSENLGLVHSCAKRFRGRGIEYDDLFQAGCVGLIKAIDNFDESRGLKLSTYAVPVILGEIKGLFRDGGAVKISRGLKRTLPKGYKRSCTILKRKRQRTSDFRACTYSWCRTLNRQPRHSMRQDCLFHLQPMKKTVQDSLIFLLILQMKN